MAPRAAVALLLVGLLGTLVPARGQDFDLSDALGDNEKKPTAPPKKPSTDDLDFSLEDAVGGGGSNDPGPPKPPKPKPNPDPKQPESAGGFSDSDLLDGTSNAGGGGGGGGGGQRPDGEEQADSPGVIPGIIGAVVMAVAGAISSFIAYQKKKLCFKENGKMSQGCRQERETRRGLEDGPVWARDGLSGASVWPQEGGPPCWAVLPRAAPGRGLGSRNSPGRGAKAALPLMASTATGSPSDSGGDGGRMDPRGIALAAGRTREVTQPHLNPTQQHRRGHISAATLTHPVRAGFREQDAPPAPREDTAASATRRPARGPSGSAFRPSAKPASWQELKSPSSESGCSLHAAGRAARGHQPGGSAPTRVGLWCRGRMAWGSGTCTPSVSGPCVARCVPSGPREQINAFCLQSCEVCGILLVWAGYFRWVPEGSGGFQRVPEGSGGSRWGAYCEPGRVGFEA